MKIGLTVIALFFLFFGRAQKPVSPLVKEKIKDSLLMVLNAIPEKTSKQKDTIRLNTLVAVIRRTEGSEFKNYLTYALNKCNSYSPIVATIEDKNRSEVQEAGKKDPYVFYYCNLKANLFRLSASDEIKDADKLNYYLRSLKICEKTSNKAGMAYSYLLLGYLYSDKSVYDKAIENLLIAQSIFKEINNKNEIANSYYILGIVYKRQNETDRAIKNLSVALNIAEESGDLFHCGVYYENIGNCYIDKKNYPKAVENHFASLKISEELKDLKGVGDSYGDIALIYYTMKNYEKSFDNWQAALNKYKEFNNSHLVANGHRDITYAEYKLDKLDNALRHLDSALVIYSQEKSYHDVGSTYLFMSDVYLKKNDNIKAIQYLDKTIGISKKHKFANLLKDSYESMTDLFVAQNDFKSAYKYNLLFIETKDSLADYGEETVENIEQIQAEFDKEKKKQEQMLHDAIIAQKEAQIKQERTQRYALYGGLAIMLLFGAFIFNRYKVGQKQQRIIVKQKQLVEEKNKEITDSINYAERIQRSFLATKELLDANLKDYFVMFKPKDVVSGDFYWASCAKASAANSYKNLFYLVTADSTGHGVPGAIMSILNISSLDKAIDNGISDPAEILNHTRSTIIERLKNDGSIDGGKDGMDCSLICFEFIAPFEGGARRVGDVVARLVYAAANNPVWIIRDNTVIELSYDKFPVGRHDRDSVSFTQHEIELQKGDMIYALTDGFPDQFGGPNGKKFKHRQLKELLISISSQSPLAQKEILERELEQWMGDLEQVDDITVIGIRI